MKIISLQVVNTIRHGASEKALSVVIDQHGDAKPLTINADHPNWDLFQKGISDYTAGTITNEDLANLFMGNVNLSAKAAAKFVKVGGILDGRMTISENSILVDHAPIDQALEGHILRLLRADGTPKDARNWAAFAKFVENLYANTSEFVREQLFAWLNYENLKGQGFTLTDDGCFIGYKGCAGTPATATSINHGQAIVNGVLHDGAIPNPLGAVVEMPRNKVQDNPEVGCSTGLHVGTFEYANSFQRGVLLTVKVNPRDVVSVPTECAAQKIRTCRYEVLEAVETAYNDVTWGSDDADWDDDEDWEDEYDEASTFDFSYVRKDGTRKDYSITVTGEDRDHLYGENEDGEPRSFIKARITAKKAAAPAAAPQASPAPASAPTSPAAVREGDVVTFDYTRNDGRKKHYEVEVRHVDSYYLDGDLTDGGGRRTFLRRNVENLQAVSSDADADDAPQADAAKVNPTPSKADNLEQALWEDLLGVLSGKVTNAVNTFFGATTSGPSDDEDPGDETEQEIRRHGYRQDPPSWL